MRPFTYERANDLVHWQTRLVSSSAVDTATDLRNARSTFVSSGVIELTGSASGFRKSLIVRDPDGHAVEIAEP